MKHFWVQRVCPLVVALSLVISMVIPVNAAFDEGMKDYDSVDEWDRMISHPGEAVLNILGEAFGVEVSAKPVFWAAVDRFVIPYARQVDMVGLENIAARCNETFNQPYGENFFEQFFKGSKEVFSDIFAWNFLGTPNLEFTVEKHPSSGLYRIYENTLGLWLVSSIGTYPYYDPSGEDHWIETSSAYALMGKAKLAVIDGSVLSSTADLLSASGERAYVADFGSKYKAIYQDGHKILANSDGYPYVALSSDPEWAVNQNRTDTTVKEDGETVDPGVTDNSTNIDLSGMTVTLPDGSINLIDQIIYDESTKTYHIDSHDTYNFEYNYYYEWNYYINYTSITYIGTTEEYNKYYEVYYELPDGRDSADLTAEELEQLNVSIDVIPYGRSADDTSLRSLYHFDGDTKDASYWNYCTDFTWNTGASLTYMDAGVFEGALYLDETEHDFTLTLPSNIGSTDFTLQFRYYQSYTAAPQTDSYITIGTTKILQFTGGAFKDGSGTQLASTPIGSWNEIALIRDGGTLYYYLNGVSIGSVALSAVLVNIITFHFGDQQETYKYFDELRVLNFPLQFDGANYEPTSVPYDTNLALVLPDTAVPVADEFWTWDTSNIPITSFDLSTGYTDCFVTGDVDFNKFLYSASNNFVYVGSHSITLSSNGVSSLVSYLSDYDFTPSDTSGNLPIPSYGFLFPMCWTTDAGDEYTDFLQNSYSAPSKFPLNGKSLTFSIVDSSGNVYSLPFTWSSGYEGFVPWAKIYSKATFSWGSLNHILYNRYGSGDSGSYIWISLNEGQSLDIVYAELVEGDANTGHEHITSVTAIDKEDLNTPTLAVRTDLDITSYQIGGVRPSVPTKGQVWALVESGYITSIQIYNGSAWEACDGRIWTGERWIPASSYNIITLQDMYDIVDATQNYEYIYSESGFWSWWQKSWNSFTEKLFNSLGSGSSGSGASELDGVDLDAEDVPSDPDSENAKSLWQFVVLVIAGGKSVITGVRHLFSGVVSSVPNSMESVSGAFDTGGIAVGVLDGTSRDPDAVDTYAADEESEVLDPWRYR